MTLYRWLTVVTFYWWPVGIGDEALQLTCEVRNLERRWTDGRELSGRRRACVVEILRAAYSTTSGTISTDINIASSTVTPSLTTGIRSEKCIVRRYRHCANVI